MGIRAKLIEELTHRRKILANEIAPEWLKSGGQIQIWSWAKRKLKRGGKAERWSPRVEEITTEYWDGEHQ